MIINEFSPAVAFILAQSRNEALAHHNKNIGPEHLLLAIMRSYSDDMTKLLAVNGGNFDIVVRHLEQQMEQHRTEESLSVEDVSMDMLAGNIVRLSVLEARLQNKRTVETIHLLQALLNNKFDHYSKNVLKSQHLSYEDVQNYPQKESLFEQAVAGNETGRPDEDEEDAFFEPSGEGNGRNRQAVYKSKPAKKGTDSDTPVLDRFSIDLTKVAHEGKLDPVVGRDREIQRLIEILGRRKKNNPILIGEPGVGKTAIVEGLAQRIVKRQTSPMLFGKRVVNLDMAAMVAGTKYRGQFEERIRALIKELEGRTDIIVFIDEIHTMVGAGGAPGSMDAANMLKPALARGVIQCIGSTTLDEYRNSIEKDGALERRFQKVLIDENTEEETLQILHNIKERYEAHHHVSYTDEAVKACVTLTGKYITDRRFPDKAIDALDETGSRVRLRSARIPTEIIEKEQLLKTTIDNEKQAVQQQNYELAASYRDQQATLSKELADWNREWMADESNWKEEVTAEDVANVVSVMSGIPVQRVAESEHEKLRNMSQRLKGAVIAQDTAIDKVVKAILRNRMGLKAPNRPVGAFMFLGPTGVGKTFLAKKLAEELFGADDALIRIDMSEYTESFNASRLIGAPPGYVGYEEGGQLTEQVRRKPYSIVLLDEIEKAHGNIFNMLLQVLDEGRLTDGNGRLVDFRNTVIIMTSNAGTKQLKEFGRGVGFASAGNLGLSGNEEDKAHARSIIQKALSKQFSPEFLNRLDDIITFDQLDMDAIKQIIDIELKDLHQRVEELGYHLEIGDKAKEFVAEKGYDVQYGARPLKRAIQTYIEDGVCELMLEGKLSTGDTIHVKKHPKKDELTFS